MIHYHPMPSALATDLYEMTMAAGYSVYGEVGRASFELWVRELPRSRNYLVAAGLDLALDYLEGLSFTAEDVEYLRRLPALRDVPAGFFDDYLTTFRFSGDVWAVPEGTPVFANEPLVRVTASLPAAQLVETMLLSTLLFQTLIASKAARLVEAAEGCSVIEFGARRAHGTEAGALAGRAAFIGGCVATSDLESGRRFGVPVSGTMAHSWVMTHDTEAVAFQRFSDLYGNQSVLLLDTYDTLTAARHIVESGLHPHAVRLDSGDLLSLSRAVRALFDAGGLHATRILASGDLDEHRIAALLEAGAPIDGFGVGTALSTSSDAPALGGVYKLVEVERDGAMVPVAKRSPEKATYPGAKQVWRVSRGDGDDTADHDVIGLEDEAPPDRGRPLLRCVMRDGRRLEKAIPIATLQATCRGALAELPAHVTRVSDPIPYPVIYSADLEASADALRRR